MLINQGVLIDGNTCTLVPYLQAHVPRYHQWMQEPSLQEATASEPLSLEEEYEMQKSWRVDPDKLTFIILDKSLPGGSYNSSSGKLDLVGPMVGDVNIFLEPLEEEEDQNGQAEAGGSQQHGNPQAGSEQQATGCSGVSSEQGALHGGQAAHLLAEVEVMVAEPGSRRKGIAREAVSLMMAYAARELGIRHFRAKILQSNSSSIELFKKLGFRHTKSVPIFSEEHLQLDVDQDTEAWQRLSTRTDLQIHGCPEAMSDSRTS